MTLSASLTYDEAMLHAPGDLESVEILRRSRRRAVEDAASGRLDCVFTSGDDSPTSRVYVVKLLDVHPSTGKVRGRRLLAELGLSEFVRVGELTNAQRTEILRACGEIE